MTVSIQASVSKGWLFRETGNPFHRAYYFDPLHRRDQDRVFDRLLEERFPLSRIHNLESNLVSLAQYSPENLLVGAIQPNMIIGLLLGADFIPYPDQDADISEKILAGTSRSELPNPESLLNSQLIQEFDQKYLLLKEKETAEVIPPFFWDNSGRAVIHGPLTSALKFYGQDFLFQFYDKPVEVEGFFHWYEELCSFLVEHFAALWKRRPKDLHVGECSGTMLGPEEYRRFILPSLRRLSKAIAPVRLHHCGDCSHLLSSIAEEDAITSLDTGNGTSLSAIRELFPGDFPVDLMPPVELLLEGGSKAALLQWIDQQLEENRQGPLSFNYHLEPGYDPENHLLLHRRLEELGLIQEGRR